MMTSTFLQSAKELLTIESTADKPLLLQTALNHIAERVAATPGITVERFERNGKPSLLAYKSSNRPAKFDVLLNGHVDVVPATTSQFSPQEKQGKLYARGALDMKVAALVLADMFCEHVQAVPYALGLQIVTDEEIGGKDGTAYQLEQGIRADFVIAGEFTPAAAICTESRGVCWAKISFRGTSAHSAYLWNGDNAVLRASAYTRGLLADYPVPAHDEWRTTANIASIATTNTTFNRVPDEATMLVDIRFVAGDKHFATPAAATGYLQSLDPHASIELLAHDPDHYADPTHPLIAKLAGALQQTTGQQTTFIKKHGASDVRFYSDRGATAVVLGLQGEGLHGDDEYLELAAINDYAQTLRRFLSTL